MAFSALLFFSIASFDPLRESTDAQIAAWWADPGHLRANVISMYLMLGSAPCFLLFLATLRGRLAPAEEGGAPGVSFMYATGVCFAMALLVAGLTRGLIAHSVKFTDEPLPGPDTLRTVGEFSRWTIGIVAVPAAGVTLGAASWVIVRSRVMAAWVGWSGLAVAAAIAATTPLLIAPFMLPLLFLWVIAASVELWRTQPAEETARGAASVLTVGRASDASAS